MSSRFLQARRSKLMNIKQPMYCVKCATPSLIAKGQKAFYCGHCEFTYFHNVAAAVGAIIIYQDTMLLLERAQNPGKGKLDIPGGFVDYDESNEQALSRELQEELQVSIGRENMSYLFSFPNQYLYKDVLYQTLDSFFEIKLQRKPELILQKTEVCNYQWVKPASIDLDALAFASSKHAVTAYLK